MYTYYIIDILAKAGFRRIGKLTARSFLQWGHKLRRGKEGCIVVFKRGWYS